MKQSWPEVPLYEVCGAIVDCVNKTAPVVEGPTPYRMIRTTNVKSGEVDLETVRYVTEDTYRVWTRRQVPRRGDVILTREAPLGEVGMLRNADGVFLGQRLMSYRANPDKLDAHFLLYALQGAHLQGQIRSAGSGATVEHMRVPDAEKLRIKLPSLPTQRKIAAILSAYDDLIENNTRRVRVLEEMARALYREWFVEFRFPGHEAAEFVEDEQGRRPMGWEWVKVGDRVELLYGRALKADERKPGPYPVYGSGGVVGRHTLPLSEGPGVIVGRKGNVGAVYWSDEPFFPIDTVYYVRSGLPLHYLYFNLQGQNFINNDAAVPGLNRNQAYSLPLLVPDQVTLGKFTAFIGDSFEQLKSLRQRNANLRRTRDLLLPRLVSGELDVSALDVRGPGLEVVEAEGREEAVA